MRPASTEPMLRNVFARANAYAHYEIVAASQFHAKPNKDVRVILAEVRMRNVLLLFLPCSKCSCEKPTGGGARGCRPRFLKKVD